MSISSGDNEDDVRRHDDDWSMIIRMRPYRRDEKRKPRIGRRYEYR